MDWYTQKSFKKEKKKRRRRRITLSFLFLSLEMQPHQLPQCSKGLPMAARQSCHCCFSSFTYCSDRMFIGRDWWERGLWLVVWEGYSLSWLKGIEAAGPQPGSRERWMLAFSWFLPFSSSVHSGATHGIVSSHSGCVFLPSRNLCENVPQTHPQVSPAGS